jgi:hypothetical protein
MSIVHSNCKIAYGCTRTVFLLGKFAIKIPAMAEWRLFLLGLLANMQEALFSKTKWPELCPVLFSIPGGFMVIMPRAEPLTREEFHNFEFDTWISQDEYRVPAENKLDSFGKLDGKIVAVDYGN